MWIRGRGCCGKTLLMLSLFSIPLQGGNDYEIYDDPRTVGHSVQSPQDTVQRCREIFFPERANEC